MEKIFFDDSAKLNMVLWGDPQVSELEPEREKRLSAACKTVSSVPGRLDVLGIMGDIAEFGKREKYRTTADLLNGIEKKAENIFCVPGNHDIRLRNYNKQLAKFDTFLSQTQNARRGDGKRYYFSYIVNDCMFICMGSDKTKFESSYISRKQLTWLEARLFEAEKAGMPAFVFNHQALKRTNGLPITWLGKGDWRGSVGRQSDKLRAILEGHGAVFFCTGHLHYGISGYNYQVSNNLHMLSVPSVGCSNHGDNTLYGQGYIVYVYSDSIRIRGADFINGTFMEKGIANSDITISLV